MTGQDQDSQDLPFVCPFCNNRFKSESALRAHKRIYNNLNNDKKSKKSVFVRTMSHPPHHQHNTFSSISSSRDHHDSSATTTQKRRRSASNSLKISSAPPAGDLVLDLEKSLKQLPLKWCITKKRGSGKSTSSSSSSSGVTKQQERSGHEEGHYIINRDSNKIKKPRRKNMKFVVLEEEEEEEGQVAGLTASNDGTSTSREKLGGGQYLCSECKTSFTSYQALSDHRSSHRLKNIVMINNKLSGADHDGFLRSADEQALDDQHKDGDDGSGDQVFGEKGVSKYVLDFDLNELPPDSEGKLNS